MKPTLRQPNQTRSSEAIRTGKEPTLMITCAMRSNGTTIQTPMVMMMVPTIIRGMAHLWGVRGNRTTGR